MQETRKLSDQPPSSAIINIRNLRLRTLIGFNPEELAQLFTDKKLKIQFSRWKNDIESVLAEVSQSSS